LRLSGESVPFAICTSCASIHRAPARTALRRAAVIRWRRRARAAGIMVPGRVCILPGITGDPESIDEDEQRAQDEETEIGQNGPTERHEEAVIVPERHENGHKGCRRRHGV
jgi:hypothetical protein